MDDQTRAMIDNLPDRTGRSLEAWTAHLKEHGLGAHGAIMAHLKGEHGVSHGYANLISQLVRRGPGTDLVAAQYAKKPAVRPLYDAVLAALGDLEFAVVPKKTAVALKRNRQFAYLQPSTKSRLDVGIQLKGEPATPRLRARKGMTSHVVAVTAVDQVDDELLGWLRTAWERC